MTTGFSEALPNHALTANTASNLGLTPPSRQSWTHPCPSTPCPPPHRYNEHLGNVCTCPSNLGTGLRASVMLKLPKLYKAWGVHKLEAYCDSLGVQARGAKGEHSPPGKSGEFDISNKARIGYSEVISTIGSLGVAVWASLGLLKVSFSWC